MRTTFPVHVILYYSFGYEVRSCKRFNNVSRPTRYSSIIASLPPLYPANLICCFAGQTCSLYWDESSMAAETIFVWTSRCEHITCLVYVLGSRDREWTPLRLISMCAAISVPLCNTDSSRPPQGKNSFVSALTGS